MCFIVLDYLSTTLQSYEKFPRYANVLGVFFAEMIIFSTFAAMKKGTDLSNQDFAGKKAPKKPSMKRRMEGHDYTDRQMYMITMVVDGRRPLFGSVVGNAEYTCRPTTASS